jgi:cell division inhibitor SulA
MGTTVIAMQFTAGVWESQVLVVNNIRPAHYLVSTSIGLCTDSYTTNWWGLLSTTEQKRLEDAVTEGVSMGNACDANPTLTMSHLPMHHSSLGSCMFANIKKLCGMSTTLGQLSPGSRAALDLCDDLVWVGGSSRWPTISSLSRVSLQSDIVTETGLPYEEALGLKHKRSLRANKEQCNKKRRGKCGERGEDDDSDDKTQHGEDLRRGGCQTYPRRVSRHFLYAQSLPS